MNKCEDCQKEFNDYGVVKFHNICLCDKCFKDYKGFIEEKTIIEYCKNKRKQNEDKNK